MDAIGMVAYSLKIYFSLELLITPLEVIVSYTCSNKIVKFMLYEVITTMQQCILNYQITAATMNEPIMFATSTFIVMLIWLTRWRTIEGSPNVIFEYMLIYTRMRKYGIFIILAKMLGGYIAFKVTRVIWDYLETGYTSVGCSAIFDEDSTLSAVSIIQYWDIV
ncbi:PREDICTED: uncharacterized protein LOC106744015 isoform X2 [Dinoponera quadriceps]|nr:PREDICTED: uncharacterized protein LOC106744015 isoform X2 [Dinoponera quadriceps]